MTQPALVGVPASSRERWSWAFYDFANSAFTTLVVTFIYSAWFAATMAETKAAGAALWSWGVGGSAVAVALLAPFVGSAADRSATRRRWFRRLTLFTVAGTVLLAFIPAPRALLALVMFGATNVAYELALALYNSFLPGLSREGHEGRLSANAWALGYVGGILCLLAGLGLIGTGWLPERGGLSYRATNLLVAAWYLLFSVPVLIWLREPPPAAPGTGLSIARLRTAARRLTRYRQAVRLLIARLVYNDGLVAIFGFGGIYADAVFGFSLTELLWFGIWINVFAGIGAVLFGHLDDWIGGKPTVMITLVGLATATIVAMAATRRWQLWVAAVLIGVMAGPNQSASRSLMARFVAPVESAEMFGLYAVSGKMTSFAGPLLVGQLTGWTGSHRVGVASLLVFFVLGALLLLRVDEREGVRDAARERARLAALPGAT